MGLVARLLLAAVLLVAVAPAPTAAWLWGWGSDSDDAPTTSGGGSVSRSSNRNNNKSSIGGGRRLLPAGQVVLTDNTNVGTDAAQAGNSNNIPVSSKYYDAIVLPRPTTNTYYLYTLGFYISGTSNFGFLIDVRGLSANTAASLPGTALATMSCAVNASKTVAWQECPLQGSANITSTSPFPYYAIVMYTNNAASANLQYGINTGAPTGVLNGAWRSRGDLDRETRRPICCATHASTPTSIHTQPPTSTKAAIMPTTLPSRLATQRSCWCPATLARRRRPPRP